MKTSLFGIIVCVWLGLGATPAHADLYSATVAYKKGDFATAFAQFKELAELGQPVAQFNLAVMYARGEGVEISNTRAHAWASLAAANGEEKANAVREELEPALTPTSLLISADIQAKYSQAALDAHLMPRFLKGREFDTREPVRPSKPYLPTYPTAASSRGIQGGGVCGIRGGTGRPCADTAHTVCGTS